MAVSGDGGGMVVVALSNPLSMACHHYDGDDFDALPQAAVSAITTHHLGDFFPCDLGEFYR